jgi:hypothetical protein
MSVSTLRPRSRLQPLATVVTWVFWIAVLATATTVIRAHTGSGLSHSGLLSQLVTGNVDWGQWPVAWSVSWPLAWTGLGLIIFARVMRIGADMRADLEGTV